MNNRRLALIVWKLVQSPVVIFIVALALRLWAASQLLPEKTWPYFYQYNEFARIAWAVATGHGYSSPWTNTPLLPTAVEPPAYAYLLAGIFKTMGAYSYESLCIAVVLNAIFSSITAVLILQVGKRDFHPGVGVLAAWVWSCWLYEAVVAIRLWESSLAGLLLIIGLFLLPKLVNCNHPRLWVAFGALAGVAGLTNTTMLAVFPCFWLWLWIAAQKRRKRLFSLSIATFVLVLVPWTVRNYVVFHRLMPVRDNFGLELWLGNHAGVGHRFDNDFPTLDPTEYNRLGELRFMEERRDIALAYIGHSPTTFLRLSLRRAFIFWTSPRVSVWLPLSLLCWLGMFIALREHKPMAIPFAAVVLIFPLIYYLTHTFNTYRHPIEPAMFLLAAHALISTAHGLQSRWEAALGG